MGLFSSSSSKTKNVKNISNKTSIDNTRKSFGETGAASGAVATSLQDANIGGSIITNISDQGAIKESFKGIKDIAGNIENVAGKAVAGAVKTAEENRKVSQSALDANKAVNKEAFNFAEKATSELSATASKALKFGESTVSEIGDVSGKALDFGENVLSEAQKSFKDSTLKTLDFAASANSAFVDSSEKQFDKAVNAISGVNSAFASSSGKQFDKAVSAISEANRESGENVLLKVADNNKFLIMGVGALVLLGALVIRK